MNTAKSDVITRQQSIDNSTKNPHVNILWTGGFDSSLRMVQLSKYQVTIQPYYICDNRRSEQNELNAISAITLDIVKHPDTKCIILPLITFKVADIEPDKEISEAFERLHKLTFIGSQYDWLSRFAKTHESLEICLEKALTGRAYNCITKNGNVKKIINGDIVYFILDEEKSDADLFKIFGALRFPHPMFELTKFEMLEEYQKLGFGETINKTWFCHTPINNETCGLCNPCKAVVEEGLSFRLSPAGLARHNTEIKYGTYKWYILLKKIRRRIVGY
jgi:7-cyano-7-deazaguanine synthase